MTIHCHFPCTLLLLAWLAWPVFSYGWNYPLDDNCICESSKMDYLSQNPDVALAHLDPVFHYKNSGGKEGRIFRCDMCSPDTHPIWPNSTTCNCSAAREDFVAHYGQKGQIDPFSYWINDTKYPEGGGKVWACDLCLVAGTGSLSYTCTCWAAKLAYWQSQYDVYLADQDPLFHYQNQGKEEGRLWNCTPCNDDSIYDYDPICNCNDAAAVYIDKHAANSNNRTAFAAWTNDNKAGGSPAWHCELCDSSLPRISPNATRPKLDYQCTCINAGLDYLARYEDVQASYLDPVYHFENLMQNSGKNEGRTWNCGLCASNPVFPDSPICGCAAATKSYLNHYAWTKINSSVAFSYWLAEGRDIGQRWKCEQCIPVIVGRSLKVIVPLGVIIALATLLWVFASTTLALFWTRYAKHGSVYSSLIMVGVMLSYIASILLLPTPTDSLCLAFPWFLGIGFVLVYGCLFIKTWCVYQVIHKLNTLQNTNVTSKHILGAIGLAVTIEIIFLSAWSAVDPPMVRTVRMAGNDGGMNYQYQCESRGIVFWAVFLGAKGIWLAFGAVLSVASRNVIKEYGESQNIAYAIYNDAALAIIAIPLVLLMKDIADTVLIVEVLVIVLTFTFTKVALFYAVWIGILAKQPKKQTNQTLPSVQSTGITATFSQ